MLSLLLTACLDAVGIRRVFFDGLADSDDVADQLVSDESDATDIAEDRTNDSSSDTVDTASDFASETVDTSDDGTETDAPTDSDQPDTPLEDVWIDPITDIDFADEEFDPEEHDWFMLTSSLGGGRFGSSLAYTPEDTTPPTPATLLVGAPEDRSIGSIAIFEEDLEEWDEVHTASPSLNAGALYGYSVGIFKETVFVGAPGFAWDGTGQGQVYFIDGRGGEWGAGTPLLRAEPSVTEFGHSLSTYRRNLAIGAPPSNEVELWNVEAGGPGSNSLQSFLGPPEEAEFGFSVDCGGDRIAVGSPRFEVEETETGSAVVYLRAAEGDVEPEGGNLIAPVAGRRFGHAVALDVPDIRGEGDNILAVGAPGDGPGDGVVYFYELNVGPDEWLPTHSISAPPGVVAFGRAVAMHDGLVAIGGETHISVYGRVESDDWEDLSPDLPDGVDSAEFGFAVEVSEWQVFVGSPDADRVYVIDLF